MHWSGTEEQMGECLFSVLHHGNAFVPVFSSLFMRRHKKTWGFISERKKPDQPEKQVDFHWHSVFLYSEIDPKIFSLQSI